MSQHPRERVDPRRSFIELIAEIRLAAPDMAGRVEDLTPAQQPIFEQQYEKLLAVKLSSAPKEKRIESAAAFAWGIARQSEAGSVSARKNQANEATSENLVWLSLPVAREHCTADAIVYRYIQKEQAQIIHDYAESYNKRKGRFWVPGYSAVRIHEDLDCFKNAQTVLDAINRLENAGLIDTGRTGAFVEKHPEDKMKQDTAMWLHAYEPVSRDDVTAYLDRHDAQTHGISLGMLMTLFQYEPETKHLYATDLAKRLPLAPETIRELRKKLPKD